MSKVKIHNKVSLYDDNPTQSDWNLWFQSVTYHYDDGTSEDGYRFIWTRPNKSLQPARGQARIPSKEDLYKLLAKAEDTTWFI